MSAAALLLSAGASTRMGSAKALLDWGGRPLLQHQIDTLIEAGCDPVIVVLGHQADAIRSRIACRAPCRMVVNERYVEGRASSVRVGAAILPEGRDAIVTANVDGPCSVTTVRRLVEEITRGRASIAVPRYDNKNGHPVAFAGRLLPELRKVDESEQGLKAVRARHRQTTRFVATNDPLVGLDLDSPSDYQRALGLLETQQ